MQKRMRCVVGGQARHLGLVSVEELGQGSQHPTQGSWERGWEQGGGGVVTRTQMLLTPATRRVKPFVSRVRGQNSGVRDGRVHGRVRPAALWPLFRAHWGERGVPRN